MNGLALSSLITTYADPTKRLYLLYFTFYFQSLRQLSPLSKLSQGLWDSPRQNLHVDLWVLKDVEGTVENKSRFLR